jgi:hypothetical protein
MKSSKNTDKNFSRNFYFLKFAAADYSRVAILRIFCKGKGRPMTVCG